LVACALTSLRHGIDQLDRAAKEKDGGGEPAGDN
jgi:hypothetical protein